MNQFQQAETESLAMNKLGQLVGPYNVWWVEHQHLSATSSPPPPWTPVLTTSCFRPPGVTKEKPFASELDRCQLNLDVSRLD